MRAANKNKYLHSIWRSLSPSLSLALCKGKLCVKSVGIFVNLKQQEPKPKPKPNPNQAQTKPQQSKAKRSQRQTKSITNWLTAWDDNNDDADDNDDRLAAVAVGADVGSASSVVGKRGAPATPALLAVKMVIDFFA